MLDVLRMYDPRHSAERSDAAREEAARQATVAERLTNRVTMEAIKALSLPPEASVVIAGAGDSTTLARRLLAMKYEVYASDIRPTAHAELGIITTEESAVDMPSHADDSAHLVILRQVCNWLSDNDALKATETAIRVAKTVVFQEFDWSVTTDDDPELSLANGTSPLFELYHICRSALESGGFHPDHGKDISTQVASVMASRNITDYSMRETRSRIAPSDKLEFIRGVAESIAKRLEENARAQGIGSNVAAGMQDTANAIRERLKVVLAFSDDQIESVKLPELVTVTVDRNPQSELCADTQTGELPELLRDVTVTTHNTPEGQRALRIVAEAYLLHGHVTASGVSANGTLHQQIDPSSRRKAAIFFITGDTTTRLETLFGRQPSIPRNLLALPTIKNLVDTYGPNALFVGPLNGIDPEKVGEFTYLASKPRNSHVVEIVLAACDTARRLEIKTIVMQLEESARRILVSYCGGAITPLSVSNDNAPARLGMHGTHYNPEGISLFAYHLDPSHFPKAMLAYLEQKQAEGKPFTKHDKHHMELCRRYIEQTQGVPV